MLTSHRCLNSSIQSEPVGLNRDSRGDFYNCADLFGILIQELDVVCCSLHVGMASSDTNNGLLDHFTPAVSSQTRSTGGFVEGLSELHHLLTGVSHLFDLFGSLLDRANLFLREGEEVFHAIHVADGLTFNLQGHLFDAYHQTGQFFDHVIEGVCQHSQVRRSDDRLNTQIALAYTTHLSDQLLYLSL